MQILEYKCGIHTGLSLVFSEVCGGLPRPIVRRDGASRQCGASQCGRVSVCLQGGPGLRGPGDSGLWHEGNASKNCRLPQYIERGRERAHSRHPKLILICNKFFFVSIVQFCQKGSNYLTISL